MSIASDEVESRAQLPVAAADDYWSQSRAPLSSLAFVAPLLLAYELGVLSLGAAAIRNGADVWLRAWLDGLGFGQYFLLPLLTTGLLLGWHHATGARWRLEPRVLGGMCLESLLIAVVLLAAAQAQGHFLHSTDETAKTAAVSEQGNETYCRLVAFMGAGIYEELLFRLMLLPAAILVAQAWGATKPASVVWGVVATSVIFSLAHYVGPQGDVWQWYSFCFRIGAGACFAVLFVRRGFGIAAGAHAAYDILAGVL